MTFGYNHAPWEVNYTRVWQNATLAVEYAHTYAAYTLSTHTDGWSLDMEAQVHDKKNAAQLTALVHAISDAVHASLPSAQVTFFSGILGFESTVDQFDLVGISHSVDFFVVGCYEAGKSLTSSDFQKANMPLPLMKKGVSQYLDHGIPVSKLILAFPWFAYSWKCSVNATTGKQECDQAHLLSHCEMSYDIANNTLGHHHIPANTSDVSNSSLPCTDREWEDGWRRVLLVSYSVAEKLTTLRCALK